MIQITRVLLFISFFIIAHSQNCTFSTGCFDCLEKPSCVWCGLENKCKPENYACFEQPIYFLADKNTKRTDNISTIFPVLPKIYPSNYFDNFAPWNISFQCKNYTTVKSVDFCPDFKIQLQAPNGETVKNLVEAIPTQPLLNFQNAKNGSNFIESTYLNEFTAIPGTFFFQNSIPKSKFFSFFYEIIHSNTIRNSPYFVNDETKNLKFSDLSLTGPPTTVSVGYAAILQDKNGKFQCSFAAEKHVIRIQPIFESFFGILFIIVFCANIIVSVIFLFLMLCCNGHYTYTVRQKGSAHRNYNFPKSLVLDCIITMIRPINYKDVEFIGTQAYFYLKYYRSLMYAGIGILITSIPLIVLDVILSNYKFTTYDFSTISFASVNLDDVYLSLFSLVYMAMAFVQIFFTFIFITSISYFARVTLPEESESTRTLLITGIPLDIDNEELVLNNFISKKFFKRGDIAAVNLCYVFENLKKLANKKMKLNTKYHEFLSAKEKNQERKKWYQCCRHKNIDDKIERITEELTVIDKLIDDEMQKPLVTTGNAFITFKTKESAQKCIKLSKNGWKAFSENKNEINVPEEKEFEDITLKGIETDHTNSEVEIETNQIFEDKKEFLKTLSFSYAPQPSSIIWENLKFSPKNKFIRQFLGMIIVVLVFITVASINLIVDALSRIRAIFSIPLSNFYLQSNRVIQFIFNTFSLFLDAEIIVTIISVVFTFITIRVLTKFVKKYSIVDEMKLNARGVLFFLFLNAFIVPKISISYFGFQVAFSSNSTYSTYDYFIQQLTPAVLTVIILVPMLVGTLTRGFQVFHIISQYLIKGSIKRIEYQYTMPIGITIYNFIHILYFSTVIPIVAVIGVLNYIYDFFMVKASIYYFHKTSENHGSTFLRESVRNLLFFVLLYPFILTLLFMRFKLYYFIPFSIVLFILVVTFSISFYLIFKYLKSRKIEKKFNTNFKEEFEPEDGFRYKHPLKDYKNFKQYSSLSHDIEATSSESIQ
eukprot:gene1658-428_t